MFQTHTSDVGRTKVRLELVLLRRVRTPKTDNPLVLFVFETLSDDESSNVEREGRDLTTRLS